MAKMAKKIMPRQMTYLDFLSFTEEIPHDGIELKMYSLADNTMSDFWVDGIFDHFENFEKYDDSFYGDIVFYAKLYQEDIFSFDVMIRGNGAIWFFFWDCNYKENPYWEERHLSSVRMCHDWRHVNTRHITELGPYAMLLITITYHARYDDKYPVTSALERIDDNEFLLKFNTLV